MQRFGQHPPCLLLLQTLNRRCATFRSTPATYSQHNTAVHHQKVTFTYIYNHIKPLPSWITQPQHPRAKKTETQFSSSVFFSFLSRIGMDDYICRHTQHRHKGTHKKIQFSAKNSLDKIQNKTKRTRRQKTSLLIKFSTFF